MPASVTAAPTPAAGGAPAVADRRGMWQGIDQAHRMSVQLIAAILVWAGLGYLADEWLGTGPWLMAAGALLGNAAGIYLVWLRGNQMSAADDAAREQRWQATDRATETPHGR